MDRFAKLVTIAACALGACGAHAQSYQVGQYLGNMNEATRFTYNTMGSAAQHANYGANGPAFTSAANGIRMAGTATATIGGRAVPLTLLSRIPTAAVVTAARGLALANPATAAVTLLGFAAMQGWLTPANLEWNTDPATNLQKPLVRLELDPQSECDISPSTMAAWQAWVFTGVCSSAGVTCVPRVVVGPSSSPSVGAGQCALGRSASWAGPPPGTNPWDSGYTSVGKLAEPAYVRTPVTWDEATPDLVNNPPTDPNIVPELLKRGASFPRPVDQTLSGPSSQPGEKTTRQNADGSKTVTTTTHNYTYNQGNTAGNTSTNITNNTTTITTVTNISNEVVSEEIETTENKPTEDVPGMCDLYPDSLACQKLDAPTDVDLTTQDRSVSITPDSGWGGAGQCPASRYIYPQGQTIEIPFTLFCTYAEGLRPVIIALAWLSAGFILLGARGGD